ncbi:unnamed protein product [Bemisia tabaci]|uniref:Gag-like protein n=1 Tax=Bemisia tabaci TaxID=7038 RepID=A0A9P0CGC9_BEMTA|nr:unnamed protein product [Bemisia tabaci]
MNMDTSNSEDIFFPYTKTPKKSTIEDGWTTVTPKRKHQSSTDSPQKDPKKKPTNSNSNIKKKTPVKVNLNNSKFSVLSDLNVNSEKSVKPSPPPPIFVSRIKDSAKFREIVVNPLAPEAKLRAINRTQLKIVVNSIDEYKNLINSFKEKKIPFHTFQPRNAKAVRMVIKGLPVDFLTNDIKNSLETKENIIIRNVTQVRRLKDKSKLALFFVDFEPWTNSTEFKKCLDSIKEINKFLVSFEPPKLQRRIIQCKNCWSFGHARGGCYRPPRCIWCGDFHKAQECPIRTPSIEGIPTCSPPPNCALCGGQHPANFLGCKVRTEIQKRKFPPPKKEETTINAEKQDKIKKSYSEILRGQDQAQSTSQSHKTFDSHLITNESITSYQLQLELFNKRLDKLEKVLETLASSITELISIRYKPLGPPQIL